MNTTQKSFAEAAEQIAFVSGMRVSKTNSKGKELFETPRDQAHLETLLDDDYQVVEEISAPSGKRAAGGKKRISKQEAAKLSDANLAESFGLPSELVSKGEGFTFKVKVEQFLEQPKRAPKVGNFPSTQVSYNGTRFCILFDASHDEGQELNCRLDSSVNPETGIAATRSGLTVTVIG